MRRTGKRRRLLAAILAGMLAVMMSMTAFATGTTPGTSTADTKGSITITNPQKGVTYSAYKIFDVTYATVDAKTSYSYTIAGDSAWYSVVNTYAGVAANKLTLSRAAGGNIYVVSTQEGFSAANFAEVLQAAVTGKTADATASLQTMRRTTRSSLLEQICPLATIWSWEPTPDCAVWTPPTRMRK